MILVVLGSQNSRQAYEAETFVHFLKVCFYCDQQEKHTFERQEKHDSVTTSIDLKKSNAMRGEKSDPYIFCSKKHDVFKYFKNK